MAMNRRLALLGFVAVLTTTQMGVAEAQAAKLLIGSDSTTNLEIFAVQAAFGPRLGRTLLTGSIVAADHDNKYGCSPFRLPGNATFPLVLVVQRGNCSFSNKSINAAELGAAALVVGNVDDSLFIMSEASDYSGLPVAYVPTVLITLGDFSALSVTLERALSSGSQLTAALRDNSGRIPADPSGGTVVSGYFMVFVAVSLCGVFFVFVVRKSFVQLYCFRQRSIAVGPSTPAEEAYARSSNSEAADIAMVHLATRRLSRLPRRASAEDLTLAAIEIIRSLPTRKFGELDSDRSMVRSCDSADDQKTAEESKEEERASLLTKRPATTQRVISAAQANHHMKRTAVSASSRHTCAICLSDFVTGDGLRTLPCSHEYHTECIDPWLMRTLLCPLCKAKPTRTTTATTTAACTVTSMRRNSVSGMMDGLPSRAVREEGTTSREGVRTTQREGEADESDAQVLLARANRTVPSTTVDVNALLHSNSSSGV